VLFTSREAKLCFAVAWHRSCLGPSSVTTVDDSKTC
jgi:hypothetical protein